MSSRNRVKLAGGHTLTPAARHPVRKGSRVSGRDVAETFDKVFRDGALHMIAQAAVSERHSNLRPKRRLQTLRKGRNISIIHLVANESGVTTVLVSRVIAALGSRVLKSLRKNGEASVVGLGTFRMTSPYTRVGHHPQTGEPMRVYPKGAIRFRVSRSLGAVRKT